MEALGNHYTTVKHTEESHQFSHLSLSKKTNKHILGIGIVFVSFQLAPCRVNTWHHRCP